MLLCFDADVCGSREPDACEGLLQLPHSDADANVVSDADLLLPMRYFGDGTDAVLPYAFFVLPR